MNQQNSPLQTQNDSTQIQPNNINTNAANWRYEMSDVDRSRLISQLSLALKHLSPATSDSETYNFASNFEVNLFQRSPSKDQYLYNYNRKLQQIRDQINQNQQFASVTPVAGINHLPSTQFNAARPPPSFYQHQNLQNQSTLSASQAHMLLQQRQHLAAAISNPPQVSNPQMNNPQINNPQMNNPQMNNPQMNNPQVPLNMMQPPSNFNFSPQQFQMYFARQAALQQQQNALQNAHQMNTNPQNFRHQPNTSPSSQSSALPTDQQSFMRPPNSQQAQQMVNQELLMQRWQQQQQQQSQPFMSMQRPMMQQSYRPVTSAQRNNAAAIVKQIDEGIRQKRMRTGPIDILSENEKMMIHELIAQTKPMYDKIDNLLPVFLAMSNNEEATRRLILLKYLFEDQLLVLPHNQYVFNLGQLQKLHDQFSSYFNWVRNFAGHPHVLNSNNQAVLNVLPMQQTMMNYNMNQPTPMMPPPAMSPTSIVQNQSSPRHTPHQTPQQMHAQIIASPSISHHSPPPPQNISAVVPGQAGSNQTTPVISSATVGMKRGSMDLKLPTAKKPKRKNSGNSPSKKNQKDVEKTAISAPTSSVVSETPQFEVPTSFSTSSSPTGVPVRAGMPVNQYQAQQQAFYIAAIQCGIPQQIASILSPRGLHFNWMLQQAAQNKMPLSSEQREYMKAVLNEHIQIAKQQLLRAIQQQQYNSSMLNNNNSNNFMSNNSQFDNNQLVIDNDTKPPNENLPNNQLSNDNHSPQLASGSNSSPMPNNNDSKLPTNDTLSPNGDNDTLIKLPSDSQLSNNERGDNFSSPFSNTEDLGQSNETVQLASSDSDKSNKDNHVPTTPSSLAFNEESSFYLQQDKKQNVPCAFKEGYKDETFGTNDLGFLSKPTNADEFEWNPDWSSGLDIGFDWDNNDFVQLDDTTETVTDSKDEKKVDEKNQPLAVRL